jgi:8-oxo-dGTP pyrophosphatase MutT (NUDIX family)
MFNQKIADANTIIRTNVAVLVRDRRGQIMLEKRRDCGMWCVPGGRIEPGESIRQTAIREILEETGFQIRITRLLGVYSGPGDRIVKYPDNVIQSVDILVEAEVVSGILAISSESEEIKFFSLADLPHISEIIPPARQVIDDIVHDRVGVIR